MPAFSACNSHGSIHLDAKVHPESSLNRSSHSHRGEIQQPVRAACDRMPEIPEPDFDDPKELFAFFGLAAYNASLLEASFINWTVALRVGGVAAATQQDFDREFASSEAKTLGQLISATRNLTGVPPDLDGALRGALAERNRLAHTFFRDHAQNLIHSEGRKVMIVELKQAIELFQRADGLVTPVYLRLWKEFGVDEQMIKRELEAMQVEVQVKYGAL